jgi:hypothetical protein
MSFKNLTHLEYSRKATCSRSSLSLRAHPSESKTGQAVQEATVE